MTFRFLVLVFAAAAFVAAGPASALTEDEYNALIQKQAQQKQILDGDEPAPIEPATAATPPPAPPAPPTASAPPPPLPSGGLGEAGLVAAGVGVALLVGVAAIALGGDDSVPATGTTGTN